MTWSYLFLLEKEEVDGDSREYDEDADTNVRADGGSFLDGDSAAIHQIVN